MARKKADEVNIPIKVEATGKGVAEATQEAEKLEKQAKKTKKQTKDLQETFEGAGQGAQQAAKGIQVLDGQMKEFAENVQAVREALEGIKAVLDKGLTFDTQQIQNRIGELKKNLLDVKSVIESGFTDSAATDNWVKQIRYIAGNVKNIRSQLFGDADNAQRPIKVQPVLVDEKGLQPLKEMLQFFKDSKAFQDKIPLNTIDQLLTKLTEISKVINEIMTGLRLDSKLPTSVLEKEIERINVELNEMQKQADKYEKIKAKFTGLDSNGKFHTNSTVSTAKNIFERNIPDPSDIQKFEKEVVKLLSLGEDLETINVKIGKGAVNYAQIVKQMLRTYSKDMLPLGQGGLKDYLSSYFSTVRDSDGKIIDYKQIINKDAFVQQYKELLAEKKYYEKQLSFAQGRAQDKPQTQLDATTIENIANAFQNVKVVAQSTGETISSVAQLDTQQLEALTNSLSNIVTWLEAISNALNQLSTNSSILANLPKFDINTETQVEDLANAITDKNSKYLTFLEQTNTVTEAILRSLENITTATNKLNLNDLFKAFGATSKGSPNELAESLKAINEAAKAFNKPGKAFAERTEELERLIAAYARFKELGGQQNIADLINSKKLVGLVESNYIAQAAQQQKIDIPVNIVPQIPDDFLGQIKAVIGDESLPINVKPNILNIVGDFVQPITEAVKGTPVEIEIKPIVNKFITDLQQTIKSLNSKEIITSLQNTLSNQSKSIKVNVVPNDVKSFMKILQDTVDALNKPIKIKIEPIVKNFIKDITTALEQQKNNAVPINLKPLINKAFKDDLQQKIDTQKIHLGLIPDKNNIQEFVNKLQNEITIINKPIKLKVEPILKDFVKRCEEILANSAVKVNFQPQNPVKNNKSNNTSIPFTNKEMQELLALQANQYSQISTNVVNGKIVSGKVISNTNGARRIYSVDQYGNEKITEQTADIIKQTNDQYKEVIEGYKNVLLYAKKLRTQTGEEAENTRQLLEETKKTTDNLYSSLKDRGLLNAKQTEHIDNTLLKGISGTVVGNLEKEYNDALKAYQTIESKVSKIAGNSRLFGSPEKYTAFQGAYNDILKSFKLDSSIENVTQLTNKLNDLYATYNKIGNMKTAQKTLRDINKFMSDNTAMSAELTHQFEALRDRLQGMIASGQHTPEMLNDVVNRFIELQNVAQSTGNVGKKFFTTFKQHLVSTNAQLVATYLGIRNIIRYIRSAVKSVTELDKALTQLKIVSNEGNSSLANISQTAYEMGQNLGLSTVEVVNSITEWRRLGKTIQESEILAEQAAKLSTGGMMDISSATTALVSSMQAFEMKADEVNKVVDQYIYLGNNYSITSEALATSLTKSMAALKVAGNSLEEIEALEVAGNAMVQDADVVSNSLKVLSLRLRGTAGSALEDLGEDTEGLIEDFSKLNGKIQALTKTASNPEGVSIIDKQTKGYKSTYQILLEISKVWKSMGNMQQAELLEIIAGKTRATAAAAILESPDLLESAYNDAMENATGAGDKAIKASMESIEKKGQQLSNNLQQIFRNLLNSDEIKRIADTLVSATNTIAQGASSIQPVLNLALEVLNMLLRVLSIPHMGMGILGGIFGAKNQLFNKSGFVQGVASKITGVASSTNITQSDIDLYQKYIDLTAKGIDQNVAYSQSFANASQSAKIFVTQQEGVANSNEEIIAGLQQQEKATRRLTVARQALNIAMSMAISIGISLALNGISKIVRMKEEERKALAASSKAFQDNVKQYKEQEESINDLVKKYEEYTKKLKDENTTEQETYQIKRDLLTLEQNLANQFDQTAIKLDLVNGEYEKQIGLIDELTEKERKKFVAENASKYYDVQEAMNPKDGWYMEFAENANYPLTWSHQDFLTRLKKSLGLDIDYWVTDGLALSAEGFKELIEDRIAYYEGNPALQDEYYQTIIQAWNDYINNADSLLNSALGNKEFLEQYERYALPDNMIYGGLYTQLKSLVDQYQKAADEEDAELLHNIADQIVDLTVRTGSFQEMPENVGKYFAEELQRYFGINPNYDKIIEEAITKSSNFGTWLKESSKVVSDEDKKENYSNNTLIDTYKSSISALKDYISHSETGEIEINFGDIAKVIDSTELFQSLGMDSFEEYVKGFGKNPDALGAYLNDVFAKMMDNIDTTTLTPAGASLLADLLYNINAELFGVSENVFKLENNYWELRDVQDKVNKGYVFTETEVKNLADKYKDLSGGIEELIKGDSADLVKSINDKLTELEKGGNVNLKLRPEIDAEDLNKLGYDAGEGFATVFSSTFSNEAGDRAINFTPIMVDPETGEYLGVMEPQKFNQYCQDVVDGVKEDDLNLQIGAEFTGEDAIEKAENAAILIHELHEQLHIATDETTTKYKIQSNAIDSLVNKYGQLSNEAITSMKNESLYAAETIKWLRQMEYEILQAQLDLINFSNNVKISAEDLIKAYNVQDFRAISEALRGVTDIDDRNKLYEITSQVGQRLYQLEKGYSYDLKVVDDDGTGKSKKDDKDKKEKKGQYDWLDSYLDKRNRQLQKEETAYDNLGKAIAKTSTIENEYYDDANASLKRQNQLLDEKIKAYQTAKEQYKEVRMREGLIYQNLLTAFENDTQVVEELIQKIINREDVDLLAYTSDQASAISAMADVYSKALDADDTILEARNKKQENRLKIFTNNIEKITKQYDRVIEEFANRQTELEHYQTMRTNAGFMENQKYYIALLDNESRELQANIDKREELIKELNKYDVQNKDDLDQWEETTKQINETTKAIYENEEAIVSLQASMRELSWDLNDKIREITGNLRNETAFLIDTLGTFEKDMYSYSREYLGNDVEKTKIYNGQMSDEGLATLALRRINMQSFEEELDELNRQIAEVEQEYLQDTANTTVLDRLNTLKDARYDIIQSYNDEREAIVDLVKDGYDKQLESLQAITDKYMEAAQAEKDLYDYQKSLKKQTKDIANLRKQMQAYAGDTSEEARAKLQTLSVQLEEAEESLADMQYERQLSDQQKIFDHLYQSLEDYFNDKLEEPENIIAETKGLVNDNLPNIKKTLNDTMTYYNSDLSQTLNNILSNNTLDAQSINSNIAIVDGDIRAINNSVVNKTAELEEYYAKYHLSEENETILKQRMQTLFGEAGSRGSFAYYFEEFIKKLDLIQSKISTTDLENTVKSITSNFVGTSLNAFSTVVSTATQTSSWVDTKKKLNPFFGKHAKGIKKLSDNELAWTQENGLEAILRPTDNAILTPLKAGDSVLTTEATQNLWNFANNPLVFMKSTVGTPTMVSKGNGVTFNNSMSPTIVLNGVSNVSDFLRELQKNKQFESMMQDMTINLMNGGSSLAKLKYKY